MATSNTERDAPADRAQLMGEVLLAIRAHQTAQDGFDEAACAVLGVNRSDGRASTSSTVLFTTVYSGVALNTA